ncbi:MULTISPECIES: hypothetical protein [unclassified Nocardioides]|uniref:hypothetical protein n=1 Tax=unclassified Nocardioides TaxID=2615069 RepID=UPI0000EB6119|nr:MULTISPECIES: hypothetical protein [unclassified Nocardioides]ABL80421.1 hypothetical protein Noca_0898 [Nocardioides sp. JS614]
MNEVLEALIAAQAGMVARRQLNRLGIDWDRVRDHGAARRWVERTPRVISTVTGELTRAQLEWLAVLHAGERSMLGGLTAAERHGLTGWQRDVMTVYVDDELSFEPVDGVRFFRSRRPFDLLRHPRPGIPVCRLEPAVLLFAAYQTTPRPAHGVIAASIQQRLTTVERMVEWVDTLRPLRWSKPFKRTLGDIAGGAHSGAEIDVRRMCRRFGIGMPDGQVSRTDRAGCRRWTDCEWRLPDGRVVVLEVDGSFHLDVLESMADHRRARRLTTATRVVLRCSAYELRYESEQVAADLIALGLPGRVPHNAA